MIQIDKNEVKIASAEQLEALRHIFDTQHCIVLNELISPNLRPMVANLLQKEQDYVKKVHKRENGSIIGEEFMVSQKNMLYNLFFLLMNTNSFLEIVKSITGCESIKMANGRIYKLDNSDETFDRWHSDIVPSEGRMIGFSINLSEQPYEGGHFLIKNSVTGEIYRNVHYDTWGTAHFFRIDKKLQHKVSKVTSASPRVAYAGWFYAKQKISDYLHEK